MRVFYRLAFGGKENKSFFKSMFYNFSYFLFYYKLKWKCVFFFIIFCFCFLFVEKRFYVLVKKIENGKFSLLFSAYVFFVLWRPSGWSWVELLLAEKRLASQITFIFYSIFCQVSLILLFFVFVSQNFATCPSYFFFFYFFVTKSKCHFSSAPDFLFFS